MQVSAKAFLLWMLLHASNEREVYAFISRNVICVSQSPHVTFRPHLDACRSSSSRSSISYGRRNGRLFVESSSSAMEESSSPSVEQDDGIIGSIDDDDVDDDDVPKEDETVEDKDELSPEQLIQSIQNEIDTNFMKELLEGLKGEDEGENDKAMACLPKPFSGAMLVHDESSKIIGRGITDYNNGCVQNCLSNTGMITIAPLKEWAVTFSSRKEKELMKDCTLYLTLEPSSARKGSMVPSETRLIEECGVGRVVVGALDPIEEARSKGCSALHTAGIDVIAGVAEEECFELIADYSKLVNSKLSRRGRRHFELTGRPLGYLHCSVIDSDDAEAFERSGNAFARDLGGALPLSERLYGTYEIAPPPEQIWAGVKDDDDLFDLEEQYNMALEEDDDEKEEDVSLDEDEMLKPFGEMKLERNPMMPFYESVDAVVVTLPKPGNGPANDDSPQTRLTGLKWLATNGKLLPPAVERILVLDAADLSMVPVSNEDPNLPEEVDIEQFWKSEGRKPPRVLLRHGSNAAAANAARAAAAAAAVASNAARRAMKLVETGESEDAAEEAIIAQKEAEEALAQVQKEVDAIQALKQTLLDMGVIVETINGKEPIDVMKHLGERNSYTTVVWRAGCWGSRGVASILNGAFQWFSAHLAVDAVGGKFWQLILAERCIQAACGPESKVKVITEEDDISIEYCDSLDKDCVLRVDGRSIRHVRVDCRVAVVDPERKKKLISFKSEPMDLKFKNEEAPWFL